MILLRLSHDTIEYANQFSNLRELDLSENQLKSFIDNPSNICYFVVINNEVVGLSWGYVLDRMDQKNMLYIHSVDVLEQHRNKGVATLMIDAFLHYQKEHHLRNTFLITDENNEAGNKLYQKFNHFLETRKNLYIYK